MTTQKELLVGEVEVPVERCQRRLHLCIIKRLPEQSLQRHPHRDLPELTGERVFEGDLGVAGRKSELPVGDDHACRRCDSRERCDRLKDEGVREVWHGACLKRVRARKP